MNIYYKFFILFLLYVPSSSLFANNHSKSVVMVLITKQSYDFESPWKKERIKKSISNGCIINNKYIITDAYSLVNHVLVEVIKHGGSEKVPATVLLTDYHRGLALLTVKDSSFFKDTQSVQLAHKQSVEGKKVVIKKWESDKMFRSYISEVQKTTIRYYDPFCPVLVHHIHTIMGSGGDGEPVFINNRLAGITVSYSSSKKITYTIGVDTIEHLMNDYFYKKNQGVPIFWIDYVAIDGDRYLRNYLGLTKKDTGIFVSKITSLSSGFASIKSGDVILSVNGTNIDDNGDYHSRYYGKMKFYGLITLNNHVSDIIKMTIIRNKKQMNISFPLESLKRKKIMISQLVYDRAPEYLIYGGLVFQNLSEQYLKTWGTHWAKKANKRLLFYYNRFLMHQKNKSQNKIIVLNKILPAEVNIGYQSKKYVILEKVNGIDVKDLNHLQNLLKKSMSQYIRLSFLGGYSIILHRLETEQSLKTVLKKYNVPRAYRIY